MSLLKRRQSTDNALAPHIPQDATFNFAALLPGRASSIHTQRAYFRWIDQYLVDIAGMSPTEGRARVMRMQSLPLQILRDSITASQLRAWLGQLVQEGNGKQGITQAKAAITTLASLLSEAELMDDRTSASLKNVHPPKAEDGQRPGRWLSTDQIKLLIAASKAIATSDNQELRNHVITSVLCTMALRRDELANARWGDLSMQNNRIVLKVHGKGRKTAMIDVPRATMTLLMRWGNAVEPAARTPEPGSFLVRRIWKGGKVSKGPVTPDGIWFIVSEAARVAGIGHVAPHDLRRSVAGALEAAGTPIEKISRLLRHSNVAVTERYLSRLPKSNEGGVLMSELLGLEPTGAPDWADE